jgi:hypothetical protein
MTLDLLRFIARRAKLLHHFQHGSGELLRWYLAAVIELERQ